HQDHYLSATHDSNRHQAGRWPPPAHHLRGRTSGPRRRRNRSPQLPRRGEPLGQSTFPAFPWRLVAAARSHFRPKSQGPRATAQFRPSYGAEAGPALSIGRPRPSHVLSGGRSHRHFGLLFPVLPAHSSVLAWRIPGTGEPGGLPSMGSHRVRQSQTRLKRPSSSSSRIDWLDLLAVRGTLKSLLQHHHSKLSILWHSALFMVKISHPYMNTGKTKALTIQTFVSKVIYLLFNTLSRFVLVCHKGS
uniref:Uncharacterized protein n=1 Tax=Ovis aries TaxID=9940 RepID=A0AC11D2P1_SHEEP